MVTDDPEKDSLDPGAAATASVFGDDVMATIPDGTVLYLDQLLIGDDGTVRIDALADDLVHLVTNAPLVSSGLLSDASPTQTPVDTTADAATTYIFEFPDVTIFSNVGLNLIFADG